MMKPSSLSTWAMRCFIWVPGMSTTGRSMRLALRMRVSMSAIGSVIMALILSPTRFLDAGDQPVAGHVAEADAADAELAIHGAGPAAQPAAHTDADLVARAQLVLGRVALVGLDPGQVAAEFNQLRFGGHRFFLMKAPPS